MPGDDVTPTPIYFEHRGRRHALEFASYPNGRLCILARAEGLRRRRILTIDLPDEDLPERHVFLRGDPQDGIYDSLRRRSLIGRPVHYVERGGRLIPMVPLYMFVR